MFIRNLTAKEIEEANQVDVTSLRDPETLAQRTKEGHENWLITMGVCTHLGCAPEFVPEIRPQPFYEDWKGGYFCPCHKSRFDMAGRVFQGVPAPTNLVVPPHYYENDATIVVGLDPQGA